MALDRSGRARPLRRFEGARSLARDHRPFLGVVGAFVGSAFLVPTLAPVAVNDDAMYARSVEILLREHELRVLPMSAATQVFQTVWAAMFGLIFGDSLGVFRVSTVAITLLGGWACYGLCLTLGVDRRASALGAAVYLFNPLSYVMSFTFMTDAPLVSLIVISAYCYARALSQSELDGRWLVFGSVAASFAFFVRQPGALVAVAVVCCLIAGRRVRLDRSGAKVFSQTLLIPVFSICGYYVWARAFHGLPEDSAQKYVAEQIPVLSTSWRAIGKIGFVQVVYPGFFVLPLALGAAPSIRRLLATTRLPGRLVIGVWSIVILIGLVIAQYGLMPYFSAFFTTDGLGPSWDLRGTRPALFGFATRLVLTALCVFAAFVLLAAVVRKLDRRIFVADPARLVLWVLVWQILGVLGPSAVLHSDLAVNFSRDRYLLPMLPLVIALLLWAIQGLRFWRRIAWAATAVIAAYAVAGTHDFLNWQRATWQVAREARRANVELVRLDGGAAWDIYHLYEYSAAPDIKLEAPPGLSGVEGPLLLSENDIGPHWIATWAPAIGSADYVVTSEELLGHTTIRRLEFSSWLRSDPTAVYLVRNNDVAGPP